MTQGFYEQLGVRPDEDAATLRKAYHRQVARLTKRARQLREQGGDVSQLELARKQLDEAWEVLSIPSRRQRYDVMLAFMERDIESSIDAEGLWAKVGAQLVPPSVAAATRLIAKTTKLAVEPVGEEDVPSAGMEPSIAPSPAPLAPTMVPADTAFSEVQPTEIPTAAEPTEVPGPPPITLPRPRPVLKLGEEHPLKVVEGTPRASSVIVLPADAPRQKTLTPDETDRLTDLWGYTGGLLRAVREAKGITLDEVASSTRISVRYLQAIESDAHERLPSATFVRGYVREIARLLKLDEEAVVAGYMRRLQG
jgi:hypothetical protein